MDEELKTWLKFWTTIATIFLGIVVSISGCTMHQNSISVQALKSGVSGIDINLAIGSNGDAVKTVALENKKKECK